MSQDEHPQKCARARHKARTKEGSNNALGRHCAKRAPLRRQGATHQKGARPNLHSAWFSKRPIVTNMEHHGNSKGTRNRRKIKNTPKRVETRFKTRQLQHNSKIDVDPFYCVLMSLPCIVQVLCTTWYIQVNLFRILVTFLSGINRQEEYCLSLA